MEKTASNTSQSGRPHNKSQSRQNSEPTEGLAGELQAIPHRDLLQDWALGFVELLTKNKAAVIAVALLVTAGFIGWSLVGTLQTRTELKAQNELFNLEKQYTEKKEKFDQARFAELAGQKQEGLTKASGDLGKDYGTLIDELEAFAKSHAGTAAGVQAAMMAAETRIAYNQADRATEALQTVSSASKASSLVGALAYMASGNTLAASGKCDQAIKAWETILSTKSAAFLHGEAALRSGLCLEKSGDKTKAAEMYRKASAESERSSTAQTAKALLRALEMGS